MSEGRGTGYDVGPLDEAAGGTVRDRDGAPPDYDESTTRRTAADRARSTEALLAARTRTRRLWRIWGAALAVFLLLVLGFVLKVWSSSEIRHVHDHAATVSPSALPNSALGTTLRASWSNGDATALGQPLYYDVVVTYSTHTVVGRDARTGAVRWSYERSDRRICTVAVGNGVAVAIYAHDGNCDEVTGLDAAAGTRRWTRTFFESGTDLDVSVRNNYVLVRTPASLHLFDTGSGLDYWYSPNVSDTACAVGPAVLGLNNGSAQVLVTQNCAGKRTLTLESATGDKDGRPTPTWSVAQNGRTPLSADAVVCALSADGRSIVTLGDKGAVAGTVRLDAAQRPVDAPVAVAVQDGAVEVVQVEGARLALDRDASQLLWIRSGIGLPAESGQDLIVAAADRVETLGVLSGEVLDRLSAAGSSAAARVTALGSGVLVAGSRTLAFGGG